MSMNAHKPHLSFAHQLWEKHIFPGDLVIDATCGNGHDTLILAKLALTNSFGSVITIDIQPEAISKAQEHLKSNLSAEMFSLIDFHLGCHSQFPKILLEKSVRLVVYNLGYLPGGNKALTTCTETTLESIRQAQHLLMPKGIICITCYPGHPEGKKEREVLLHYVEKLNYQDWSCSHHHWVNTVSAPSVILIQSRK